MRGTRSAEMVSERFWGTMARLKPTVRATVKTVPEPPEAVRMSWAAPVASSRRMKRHSQTADSAWPADLEKFQTVRAWRASRSKPGLALAASEAMMSPVKLSYWRLVREGEMEA